MEQFPKPPSDQSEKSDSLQHTLDGKYQFDIKQVFLRANDLVKKHFSSLVQACVLIFLALVIMALVMQSIQETFQALFQIAVVLVIAPLQTGLYMMGVSAARGQHVRVFDLFKYLPVTIVLALTHLITIILTQLGTVLFIIPGIYMVVASTFALILVADRQLTAVSAIILSCRIVNRYFWKMLLLLAIFLVLILVSILTFGFGLIWVMPLYFCAIGVLYEGMVGQSGSELQEQDISGESTFDA
ncbi:stress protein [Alteromonas sp. H39]|uniref:stress protein n=1 Tax=Alteromonas sp. H39 TaxID=3389876 RepID=UPI0039E03360